jgi:hypothetical protein
VAADSFTACAQKLTGPTALTGWCSFRCRASPKRKTLRRRSPRAPALSASGSLPPALRWRRRLRRRHPRPETRGGTPISRAPTRTTTRPARPWSGRRSLPASVRKT